MASFLVNNKWNVRNTGWFYGIMEQPKDVLSIINYQTHVFFIILLAYFLDSAE